MCAIKGTTATGSGEFESLFPCLFSCAGLLTWTNNQSAFSYWVAIDSTCSIGQKASNKCGVPTLLLTPHRPETPTLTALTSPDPLPRACCAGGLRLKPDLCFCVSYMQSVRRKLRKWPLPLRAFIPVPRHVCFALQLHRLMLVGAVV